MPEIITRAEAKARGLKRYFTGEPCGKGHISDRLLSNNGCIVCRNIDKKNYALRYPEKMKEKAKRRNPTPWCERSFCVKERQVQRVKRRRIRERLALKALQELGIEI